MPISVQWKLLSQNSWIDASSERPAYLAAYDKEPSATSFGALEFQF